MNKKRSFLIVISIFVLIIIIGILNFANRNKVIKTTQEYLQAQENFKENSELDENEEEFVFNCDIVADIQEKTDDVYSVLMNFTSDRCIKKVYDATDSSNKVLLCDWTHNEGKSKSEVLDLHKNKQYKFEIELATGKKIEEDFKLENAEIKLNKARKNQDGTWKFPNATVKNNCGDDIKYIVLQFASGIKSGDKLIVNNVANANVNSTNTMVSINVEGKTSEEIESIIRDNLKVQLVDRSENEEVSVKLSINNETVDGNVNYYYATQHFYEYVPSSGIAWTAAKTAAEERTYMGMHGYLATLTSEGEDNFAKSLIDGYGWLGGTCDYNFILDENGNKIYNSMNESLWNWYWVTGPEAGTKFWSRSENVGAYTNWKANEPNNADGNEFYLHFYTSKLWNDYCNVNSPYGTVAGYIVEYGGMPGDVSTIEETYSDVSIINTNKPPVYEELVLFDNGNQCESITGGWTGYCNGGDNPSVGNAVIGTDCLEVNIWGIWCSYGFETINTIDFSDCLNIVFEVEEATRVWNYNQWSADNCNFSYGIINNPTVCRDTVNSKTVYKYDVSNISNGKVYIGACNQCSIKVSKIYLEKIVEN